MIVPRFEDRIVQVTLQLLDLTNPVTAVAYSMGNQITGGLFNPVIPRACKLIGYGVSTITLGDTTPGNWTIRFRINESGSDTATFDVNVTTSQTKQTAATVPWSTTPILQAGTTFHVLATGPSKNAVASYLTLEFELI